MNILYFIIPLVVAIGFLVVPFVMYAGNHIMVVSSDSMLPTLKPNDLIVVEKAGIDEIIVGDIIAFDSHQEDTGIIAHRAIEIAEIDGKLGIDTKGDHLENHDFLTVYDDDLIGKVTEINPAGGVLLSDPVRYSLVGIVVASGALLARESIRKKSLELKQLRCLRCDHTWYPRVINGKVRIPDTCPHKDCRSPYWNRKRLKG